MPETIEENIARGAKFHRDGDLDAAEDLYRTVLEADPKNADATNLLGVLASEQGFHDEAVDLISQAIEYQPENSFYLFSLGNVFLCQSLYEDAEFCFLQSLDLDPNQGMANQNLSVALRDQGKFSAAAVACARALEQLPQSVETHHLYSEILYNLGRHPDAVEICQKALELEPQNAETHKLLGNALKNIDDIKGAMKSYRKGVELTFGLNPEKEPTETLFTCATHGKLEHDIEQLTYLMKQGVLGDSYKDVISTYSRVLDGLPPPNLAGIDTVEIPSRFLKEIAPTYNRLVHLAKAPALDGPAVNPDLDGVELEKLYQESGPGYICIDNFLTPQALNSLRDFCLKSTIWFFFNFAHGRVSTVQGTGFFTPLLSQISNELSRLLPNIFMDYKLNQAWGYKYNAHPQGIKEHADFAAVNVNFWLTPDEANKDPDSGGLVVWDKPAPIDWTFAQYNQDSEGLRDFLAKEKANRVVFPHRQNRVVIFNSNLIHKTDNLTFKPGYENHRINVTLLYGDRKTA